MKYEDGCNIIVLMTGDGDMVQAVEKVIDQKGIWKVEVVGLEHSMSKQLKELADQHPQIVTIQTLPNVILAGGKQMKIAGTPTEKKVDETVKAKNKNVVPELVEAKSQDPVAKNVSIPQKNGKNVSSEIHPIPGML
jgi:hypothetical protein